MLETRDMRTASDTFAGLKTTAILGDCIRGMSEFSGEVVTGRSSSVVAVTAGMSRAELEAEARAAIVSIQEKGAIWTIQGRNFRIEDGIVVATSCAHKKLVTQPTSSASESLFCENTASEPSDERFSVERQLLEIRDTRGRERDQRLVIWRGHDPL